MNELRLEDTTPVRITQAPSPFVSNFNRSVLPHTCVFVFSIGAHHCHIVMAMYPTPDRCT
jgi:hypothetical protein